jgi:hypothetical protein
MGYRSEVAYVIRFNSKADMGVFINVQLVKKDEHITQALKELTQIDTTADEGLLFFYADDVKWYDSFPEVQAHTQLYKDAVEMFDDACYIFLRCGESVDDVEEEGEGDDCWDLCDYITISRPTISVDTGITKPILNEEGETV